MAINRVLNAIWAEISTRGSLIKTATNPYNPNPGAEISGANNQGMAAITAGSPFITLDANGLAVGVPVSTSLGAFSSGAGTPLDENSGKYHVVRQYGDIYLYNDGNIISWGGNGKNFGFGNGYEENHAWASGAYVYNNETFTIPAGAMSNPNLFATAPSPSPTADSSNYEWLGGAVSKSWGVEYTYTYGTSYEWSGGPDNYIDAYGNSGNALSDLQQGKHCTYSYGNGYEEALVGWTSTSTWFHADDPGSPYLSRASDKWQSSNLGSSWTAANLLVSKAFGPTYDYHYGSTLSIQEGPSEERVNGASWSTVTGDSNETVTGNSTETVNGNSTSTVNGDSNETVTGNSTSKTVGNNTETHWGLSDEYFMGGKSEMMLAGCDEINLAAKMEIVGGAATEIFLGAKLEIALGALMEIKAAAAFEVANGAKIEITNGFKCEVDNAVEVEVADLGSFSSALVKIFTP